jgi:hypothetical protein
MALKRSLYSCGLRHGCTCQLKESLAATVTRCRRRTSRRTLCLHLRTGRAMPRRSTVGWSRGIWGGLLALALEELQFVGGVCRLGRTQPTMGGLARLGGSRPRQFEGREICLGRRELVRRATRNAALRLDKNTSRSRCATMPSAWRRRGRDRAFGLRKPPPPSDWRRCGGALRPAWGSLVSMPRRPKSWARDGLGSNPPLRQARPPKRVATARRRHRWGQMTS